MSTTPETVDCPHCNGTHHVAWFDGKGYCRNCMYPVFSGPMPDHPATTTTDGTCPRNQRGGTVNDTPLRIKVTVDLLVSGSSECSHKDFVSQYLEHAKNFSICGYGYGLRVDKVQSDLDVTPVFHNPQSAEREAKSDQAAWEDLEIADRVEVERMRRGRYP